jgi:hypothetical protein
MEQWSWAENEPEPRAFHVKAAAWLRGGSFSSKEIERTKIERKFSNLFKCLVPQTGLEPVTPSLRMTCSTN